MINPMGIQAANDVNLTHALSPPNMNASLACSL